MQIFGRDALSIADLWQLYSLIATSKDIWHPDTFASCARQCGLRRIAARREYFSFSAHADTRGQAPITSGFIEEIRLFMGNPSRNLSEDEWNRDCHKLPLLASEYSALFCRKLGPPRKANSNDIFEYDDHRIRVLASQSVWVVISNLEVISRLPNDWWAPPACA